MTRLARLSKGGNIKLRSLIGVQQNQTDFLLQELQHSTGNFGISIRLASSLQQTLLIYHLFHQPFLHISMEEIGLDEAIARAS